MSEKKKWLPILIVLLLFALITSCIAGYILGKNSMPDTTGQLIDTILLQPEDAEEQAFYLTGQIIFSDGTPYANGKVRIHSKQQETLTDSEGRFVFFQVEKGEHTVSIVDENESVLAERKVNLSASDKSDGVDINLLGNGSYGIGLGANVRLLEINVELDTDARTLYINREKFTYVTSTGKVATPAGEASYLESTVVTPGGTVITTDGTIITPSSKGQLGIAVITPEEKVEYPEKRTEISDGTIITDEGKVVLPNGTEISFGGGTVITTPGGESKEPGASGVVITNGNEVTPIGQNKELETGQNGDNSKPSGDSGSGSASKPDTGNQGGASRPQIQEPDNTHTEPSNPDNQGKDPEVKPEPSGELPDFNVSWTQGARIDLFADRTGGGLNDTIAPGSKGRYYFEVKNGNDFPVDFVLAVSEEELHIPMRFRIVESGGGQGVLADWWSTREKLTSKSSAVQLMAGRSGTYFLEWEWLYEGGNDSDDTLAGAGGNKIYTLELAIQAEQVIE